MELRKAALMLSDISGYTRNSCATASMEPPSPCVNGKNRNHPVLTRVPERISDCHSPPGNGKGCGRNCSDVWKTLSLRRLRGCPRPRDSVILLLLFQCRPVRISGMASLYPGPIGETGTNGQEKKLSSVDAPHSVFRRNPDRRRTWRLCVGETARRGTGMNPHHPEGKVTLAWESRIA